MRLAARLPLLALFAALAAPQVDLSPVVRTVTVPIDGPGVVTIALRANGGYSADFEPSGAIEPTPQPKPQPTPTPTPQGDLEQAAAEYMRALPGMLVSAADAVEAGQVRSWNSTLDGINVARRVIADDFGDALDLAVEQSGGIRDDDEGTIIDRAAVADVLRRAARAR